ncbi:hypothetical protein RSSM_01991 [Rhodopirellula sallentina SM41]|uniref:Uncharacterized protein n=1 Tax=Rhodopirellula sallentina SM41 TaxID=1263870 RepID=M5UKG9_9BACT|nr:hypothetical protein RSSM_01991 [Rhodopirellula sallentina SM41]
MISVALGRRETIRMSVFEQEQGYGGVPISDRAESQLEFTGTKT